MIVIPLLIETGRQYRADRVLVVDVSESTQIARVEARSGLGRDEIQRIIASQATRGERRAAADDLIDNDGSPSELIPQVEALHRRYLSLAR
jgi:dephospho-CoA kinase